MPGRGAWRLAWPGAGRVLLQSLRHQSGRGGTTGRAAGWPARRARLRPQRRRRRQRRDGLPARAGAGTAAAPRSCRLRTRSVAPVASAQAGAARRKGCRGPERIWPGRGGGRSRPGRNGGPVRNGRMQRRGVHRRPAGGRQRRGLAAQRFFSRLGTAAACAGAVGELRRAARRPATGAALAGTGRRVRRIGLRALRAVLPRRGLPSPQRRPRVRIPAVRGSRARHRPAKRLPQTCSATSSSIELEWVFFSVTPSSGSMSMMRERWNFQLPCQLVDSNFLHR